MEWMKNRFKAKPQKVQVDAEALERKRKFDEQYGERMKKPQILSKACPNCGSEFPWVNLESYVDTTRKAMGSKIPPLDSFDSRWICLNCLHIWIDSEHEDPNGWWHTHNSKEEYLQSLDKGE